MPPAAPSAFLQCRISPDEFAHFAALAPTLGLRGPSALLAGLVRAFLKSKERPIAEPKPKPVKVRLGKDAQVVKTRVSAEQGAKLTALAASYGGVSPWLRGRVDAALGDSQELPAESEIRALHEAVLELWHVGNNLNQIAREFNRARLEGNPPPVDAMTPELIDRTNFAVKHVADRCNAVIAAARARGVGRA